MPYESYDGVEGLPGNEQRAYCMHMSVLFLSWHRPYLALYEQILYDNIQFIASLYPKGPQRERYEAAAKTFRIPYWDWAMAPQEGGVYPRSVQLPSVVVDGPAGTQTIANPLFSYDFHPFNASDLPTPYAPQFSNWDHTLRSPSSQLSDAVSEDFVPDYLLNFYQPSNQVRLYNLFATYKNFTTFSNSAWIFNQFGPEGTEEYSNYDSIESIHDLVHGVTGMGGHMTMVDLSAFDPLFMLHHAMVDRVWAMWQVLNPEAWIEPQAEMMDTFTIRRGQLVDGNTPLAPFHTTNGGIWLSNDVKDTTTFGYAYAETRRAISMTDAEFRVSIVEAINRLYGSNSTHDIEIPSTHTVTNTQSPIATSNSPNPSNTFNATVPSSVVSASTALLASTLRPTMGDSMGSTPLFSSSSTVSPQAASTTTSRRIPGVAPGRPAPIRTRDVAHREYLATIKVPKQLLNKPFFIHLFIGDIPTNDPKEWAFAPNLAGSHVVFSSITSHKKRSPDSSASGESVTSTIPLTAKLREIFQGGELETLDLQQATEYMKRELKYNIVTVDGELIDNALFVGTGLRVEVASAVVQQRTSDAEFPIWGALEMILSLNS